MKIKTLYKLLVLTVLLGQTLFAQNMWMWNQRTHPELEWQTLETEHFNIHFHHGLDSIAMRGARIAEQAYQPTLDQLQLEDFGKTDIVFSGEDEIMNGFAMPSNQIFIWVSQNDVAGGFGGSDKWLKLVITHEFQHVAQFQAHRTWAGIWAGASIPAWWIEGMAEYLTEVWRVGRSDSRMKIHTYRNTMDQLGAHDDGYAKVLYLAWKYGDSTLVQISNHRKYIFEKDKKYPYWYNFKTAFEDVTGQSLKDFNEEWRRVMNTYYYGYKAQKENVEEIGDPFIIKGFSRVTSVAISKDSSRIAIVGRTSSKMRDYGLYTQSTDSNKTVEEIHFGRFSGRPSWSPDNRQMVIAEYHRGKYGSLIHDLRLVDLESKKKTWLTQDLRALHPIYSKEGKGVFFVAHPGETTQIHYLDLNTMKRVQVSQFTGDVQIKSLNLSPDGIQIAFMIQEENGDVNIAVMNLDGSGYRKVTDDPEEDVRPVWSASGESIVFTSFRNSTPNLYRVDLMDSTITQMTDVAGGIYSMQRLPNTDKIIAATLGDVDSVRIRTVDDDRIAPQLSLNIREPYLAWRNKTPDIQLPEFDYSQDLEESVHSYKGIRTFRPLFKLVWPIGDAFVAMGAWNDALGKHSLQAALALPYTGHKWGGYLGYLNLNHKPALNIYGTNGVAFRLQQIDGQEFIEYQDGLGAAFQLPLNAGNSLSSNHLLKGKLAAVQRNLTSDDPIAESITSADTRELNISIDYLWKSQRPHSDAFFLPRDGQGILLHAEKTLPEIWGDNNFWQYWVEGFFNLQVPRSPFVWFNRMKFVGQGGDILAQDALGFSERLPFYYSTPFLTTIRSTGLFDTPETYNLRGQTGEYWGSELFYATSELRFPLFPDLPVDIFGIGFKNFTTAIFYDYAYMPVDDVQLETYGAEIRFIVSAFDLPLVTLATGWGGDSKYWESADDDLGNPYLRMALVNPF